MESAAPNNVNQVPENVGDRVLRKGPRLSTRNDVSQRIRDMSPLFSIKPEAVAVIDAADKQAILERLSQTFAASYGLDVGQVLDALEERERLGSTGFGRGVAIPHARISGLQRPVAALLKLPQPVDFASADGLPVDLVFGLLSPDNSGATHLHALAAISRLMRDERVHEALSDAPDAEALYGLLTNVTDRDAA